MSKGKKKKRLAVYYPIHRVYGFVFFGALLILFGYILVQSDFINKLASPGDNFDFLFSFGLLFTAIFICFIVIIRDRLVIVENGLIWWYCGIRRRVTWSELSHFSWQRRRKTGVWGIVLTNKKFFQLDMYVNIPSRSLINRQKDIEAFKKTEAGAYLYHYAPHLFDESEKSKKDKYHA